MQGVLTRNRPAPCWAFSPTLRFQPHAGVSIPYWGFSRTPGFQPHTGVSALHQVFSLILGFQSHSGFSAPRGSRPLSGSRARTPRRAARGRSAALRPHWPLPARPRALAKAFRAGTGVAARSGWRVPFRPPLPSPPAPGAASAAATTAGGPGGRSGPGRAGPPMESLVGNGEPPLGLGKVLAGPGLGSWRGHKGRRGRVPVSVSGCGFWGRSRGARGVPGCGSRLQIPP